MGYAGEVGEVGEGEGGEDGPLLRERGESWGCKLGSSSTERTEGKESWLLSANQKKKKRIEKSKRKRRNKREKRKKSRSRILVLSFSSSEPISQSVPTNFKSLQTHTKKREGIKKKYKKREIVTYRQPELYWG